MSKLAIVGASGLVGRNLLEQLQKREFKIDEIFLLGKKSAGSSINFLDKDCRIEDIDEFDFNKPDYAILSAGSDVAGLRSKAVQDGENWIVNGQKVWTSGAHFSDFGILVVRHDPGLEKHKGLTFFFVDMKSPGIEVKPIKQLTGGSSFNEVYFNDVVIPDSQRLGEIGDGWKVAITTLMNERLAVGDADGVDANEAFELAKKHDKDGEQLIDNNAVRESIADWYCEASGLKNTKLRTMSALSRGDTPGPEASITKIVSANKLQAIGNFGMDSSDMSGMLMDEESDFIKFQMAWMGAAGLRIAGGTDEILKNIIAERVLGLPQEARADKGLAFKDIPSGS